MRQTAVPLSADGRSRLFEPLPHPSWSGEQKPAGRLAGTHLLRTTFVRDPTGYNIVIFDPAAFAERSPHHGKAWHLRYENERLIALAAFSHEDWQEFMRIQFGVA